jgi:hypothetical protein
METETSLPWHCPLIHARSAIFGVILVFPTDVAGLPCLAHYISGKDLDRRTMLQGEYSLFMSNYRCR